MPSLSSGSLVWWYGGVVLWCSAGVLTGTGSLGLVSRKERGQKYCFKSPRESWKIFFQIVEIRAHPNQVNAVSTAATHQPPPPTLIPSIGLHYQVIFTDNGYLLSTLLLLPPMGTRVWARPPLADSDSPHLTPPSIFPPPTSSPAALEAAVANFNGSFFTFLGEDVTDSSSRDSEREVELGPKKSLEDEYSDHFLESVNEGEWGGYRDGEGVEEEDEEESGEDTEDENQGAPSREPHYQLPPLHDFNHDINVNIIDPYLTTSPSSTTQHQEEPQQLHIPQQSNSTPFIPVLSRPRHAHPRKAYKNEDQSLSDYDEDLLPVREADDDGTFALPPLNHRPTSVEGSSRSKSRSSSPFSTRNKSKRKKSSRSSVSSSTVSDYQHNSNGGAGIGLRRTELPAVEDVSFRHFKPLSTLLLTFIL